MIDWSGDRNFGSGLQIVFLHVQLMKTTSRRHFLQATAARASALSSFPAFQRATEQTRQLRLVLIGCGWYGMVDVKAAFQVGGGEVIALCDVDSEHLSQSAAEVEKLQGKRPQTFKLYEELLKMA